MLSYFALCYIMLSNVMLYYITWNVQAGQIYEFMEWIWIYARNKFLAGFLKSILLFGRMELDHPLKNQLSNYKS